MRTLQEIPRASSACATATPRARAAGTRSPCKKKTALIAPSRLRPGALFDGLVSGDGLGTLAGLAGERRPAVHHFTVPGLEHHQVPDSLAVVLPRSMTIEEGGHRVGLEQPTPARLGR